MSRLDALPPDQRAALSLLLRRRRGYADLAGLLSISERAVHDRAHAALAVLAPREARELAAEDREKVGDYLLGAGLGEAQGRDALRILETSAAARAWAHAIAAELAPLSQEPLPRVPSPSDPAGQGPPTASRPNGLSRDSATPAHAGPAPARVEHVAVPAPLARSSRLYGALMLAALIAGVIVAVVLISNHDSGSRGNAKPGASAGTASAGAGKQASTSSRKTTEDRRITLTPPNSASSAVGVAEVLSEGSKYAFYLAAEHLPPSKGFFYAVWLYNSPTSAEALSKSPPVGSNGRLQGGALLPADASRFHRMLLTRERSEHPTHPGPIVLSGVFGLH